MVRLDRIRLEMTTLVRVGVTSLLEKIIETSLRYFGHVEKTCRFYSKKSRSCEE